MFDKTQILANLDHLTVTSCSPRNIRVKKLSPDAVMLIFQVTVQGNYDGHNFHADSNAASLWMQRGSKWLDLHFQESPVPTSDSQDTRIVDEQAIRAADAAWLKAVQVRDVDRIVSFYADDASEFPIAEPIATGKDAMDQSPCIGSAGCHVRDSELRRRCEAPLELHSAKKRKKRKDWNRVVAASHV